MYIFSESEASSFASSPDFFYKRLQVHKIERLRRLFNVKYCKSSDLGTETPQILLVNVFFVRVLDTSYSMHVKFSG